MRIIHRWLILALGCSVFTACASLTSGLFSAPEYAPPVWLTESSTATTRYWSVDVDMVTEVRNHGIWEITYEVEVPEKQLAETPLYFPFRASGSWGDQRHYWMVHCYSMAWIHDTATVVAKFKNTSNLSAPTASIRFDGSRIDGVQLFGNRTFRDSVLPGETVSVDVARIHFPRVSDTATIAFRIIDLPISLNPDGSIRELRLVEEQFTVIRNPHTYESTLTYGTILQFYVPGQDGSAHILDREQSSYGQHYVKEVFAPVDSSFRIELGGPPATSATSVAWVERDASQPHDFGQPERRYAAGVPRAVREHK